MTYCSISGKSAGKTRGLNMEHTIHKRDLINKRDMNIVIVGMSITVKSTLSEGFGRYTILAEGKLDRLKKHADVIQTF